MTEPTLKLKPVSSTDDREVELRRELQALEDKYLDKFGKEFEQFLAVLKTIEIPATGPVPERPAPWLLHLLHQPPKTPTPTGKLRDGRILSNIMG
jgi:hypothetical protein